MQVHNRFSLAGVVLLAVLLVSCVGSPLTSAPTGLPPAGTVMPVVKLTGSVSFTAQAAATSMATPRPEPTQTAAASPTSSPTEPISPLPSPTATAAPTPTPSVDELRAEVEELAPASVLLVLAQNATASPQEMMSALAEIVQEPAHGGTLIYLQIAPVPGSQEIGAPAVLVSWRRFSEYQRGQEMLVTWLDAESGVWNYQMFLRTDPGMGFIGDDEVRAARSNDQPYLAVIRNPCAASPWGYCQGLFLYQLADGAWRQVWPAQQPSDWNYSLAQAEFSGDGIDTVAVRNSDWQHDDAKSKLFAQNHGSLHRWFNEIWQREGDHYTLVERQVEPSPYNTMVEFIYALQTNGHAARWVVSPETVVKAEQLGLRTIEYFMAGCQQPSCEQQGPLDLLHASQPVSVTFVRRDGQFLIDELQTGQQQTTSSQ